MTALPSGAGAVMASRREPPGSLDFFPTPPWATRALCEHVLFDRGARDDGGGPMQWRPAFATIGFPMLSQMVFDRAPVTAWDPCAGDRHMSAVLPEYFGRVLESDVHDYGHGYRLGSFTGGQLDAILPQAPVSFAIFNPPFNAAAEFVERGLSVATDAVAVLVRSVWAEGKERWERLFWRRPPTLIAQFCERVNMCKGRWDPDGSTATSYAWFVWTVASYDAGTRFLWIPPGRKSALERPVDRARFAPWSLHPCPPDELERIARELCEADELDPIAPVVIPRFETVSYLDRRGAKPLYLSERIPVVRWQARIREADDVWARRLQVAKLSGAAA